MKNFLYLVILIFLLQNCSSWKKDLASSGNYEIAIKNAIVDFCNASYLAKEDKIFTINYKEYSSGIIGISILGDDNKVYIVNGSPTRGIKDQYMEYHGKLFYWNDNKKEKNPNIMDKLLEYNVIQRVDSLTEDMGYIRDDSKKAVNYYFCKNNLSVYKKETSSIAMPREKENNLNCR